MIKSKRNLDKRSSKLQRYGVKAKLKLTNTKETLEPEEIIAAKARLKESKNVTAELEIIANNLHLAQIEEARLCTKLYDSLSCVTILDPKDKFGIFLNNMGRISQNTDEIYQMYLINMKDQLIKPLNAFNNNAIQKCQNLKVKLKTKKGQYDITKKDDDKMLKNQQSKNMTLSKVKLVRSKSGNKLNELETVRNEFISAVKALETEKLVLLTAFQQYIGSYAAYTKINVQNLKMQNNMLWVPPNINNIFGLDADIEDIHDNDDTMSTFSDWGKTAIVIKEGWIKKRGHFNKSFKRRWFKLFTNKKLIYLTQNGVNGALKGHIDLIKIIALDKKAEKLINIDTKTRSWYLQFETRKEREDWFKVFIETKGVRITQTANLNDFGVGDNYDLGNGENTELTEEKQEIQTMQTMLLGSPSSSFDPSEYTGIKMRFVVIVDDPAIYNSKDLTEQISFVQIKKGAIVDGQYIDSNVILLETLEVFISTMDVVEAPNDEILSFKLDDKPITKDY